MIRKIALTLTTLCMLAAPIVLSGEAYAVNAIPNCGHGSASGTPAVCSEVSSQSSKGDPVLTIIKAAIDVVSYIAGALAVIFIVAAALRFILSGGDANAAATARNNLIYALAGIVVVGLAQTLVIFVLNKA
jgi:Type IV secretion system pilin